LTFDLIVEDPEIVIGEGFKTTSMYFLATRFSVKDKDGNLFFFASEHVGTMIDRGSPVSILKI